MRENNDIIIQGRNSFFFAKQSGKPSINILFTVDPAVGAERKIKEGVYPGKSVEDVMAIHRARETEERKHYLDLYEIEDYLNRKHYNLIIDTSAMTAEEVFKAVLEKVKHKIS
jgi:cytidylate kinase